MFIKNIFIITLLISLTACSTSKHNIHVENPQLSFAKYKEHNQKDYTLQKMNNLNIWWQQLEEPGLMLLIKFSQDENIDSYNAKKNISRYLKINPTVFLTVWEKEILYKNILLQNKSSYWYDLRTSLSSEVSRQVMIYQFNKSQINLLGEPILINNDIQKNKAQLEKNIQLSLTSLNLLTNKSVKEIKKILDNDFISIGEKIMNNNFPFVSSSFIDASSLTQRPDVYFNITQLQNSLFESTQKKYFPEVFIEGNLASNQENLKIITKFKDSEKSISVNYKDFEKTYSVLENNISEISQDTFNLIESIQSINLEIILLLNKNKQYLADIRENPENKEILTLFLINSLNMIKLQENKFNQWINLYKNIGGSF